MLKKIILIALLLICNLCLAKPLYPWYGGLSLGFGSTDWSELVNHDHDPNDAPAVLDSAPEKASDRGLVYGGFLGYSVSDNYAVELTYRHFRKTSVYFNTDYSIYYINGEQVPGLVSSTWNISLLNKFILPVSKKFAVFSAIGPGYTHRHDIIVGNLGKFVATFGAGVNYTINPHWMATVEGDYSTGWGKAELYPVHDYLPFLYSVDAKIAYRF